jgi:hypothetical protein
VPQGWERDDREARIKVFLVLFLQKKNERKRFFFEKKKQKTFVLMLHRAS